MYEAHLLAYFYHWSADFIMTMPTRVREEWCTLIRAQINEENEAMNNK